MRTLLFKLFGLLLIAGSLGGGWLGLEMKAFKQNPLQINEQTMASYLVEPGANLRSIAQGLAERGLIKQPRYLVWWGRWLGQAEHIKAGEYAIKPGMTALQLLQQMVDGEVIQHTLTLVEGWSFKQVMVALRAHHAIRATLQGLTAAEIMSRLGYAGQHPEGRFFPDTYHFPKATSDIEFLRRAYSAMAERLEQEWVAREPDLPLKSAYEALILASIIEKESAVSAERAEIAGVFIRRLNKGMRLQTDPTVIYGMGEAYDGNIRRRDLRHDTPYNTYTRKGLPPTPIAMPGGEAIHAALHPASAESLYFVARGDGTHYFSATLEEHNRAVRKYQLKR